MTLASQCGRDAVIQRLIRLLLNLHKSIQYFTQNFVLQRPFKTGIVR